MTFFGGSNPNMMNGAFYQALLGQMQGGNGMQSGSMPSMQNMAPQIAQQQRQPTSNISPVPQQQQQQQQPGGGIGAAVKGGQNLQALYGMGKDGYNNINGMFGSNPPPALGNPNAMSGAPVANNAAGNSYLAQNPGMAQGGMQGTQGAAQPFFGGMSPSAGMYGPSGLAGMGQGGATGQMYGSMGATGQGMAGAGSGSATGATGAAGAGADASSSSPSWLSQLWDLL